jgi:hypothetical protein
LSRFIFGEFVMSFTSTHFRTLTLSNLILWLPSVDETDNYVSAGTL